MSSTIGRRRRHRRTPSRTSRRKRRGGGSASSYGMHVNGTPAQQFTRVFSQSGPYGKIPGNVIIGAQGQRAGRRVRRRRSHKGGMWGEVARQAVVPLALLGMHQLVTRKHKKRKK